MDMKYAELSLRTGIFCAAADEYLGKPYFAQKGRENCWSLTEELLYEWKQEAIGLGVPVAQLALTEQQLDMFPRLLEQGMAMQIAIDKARKNVN